MKKTLILICILPFLMTGCDKMIDTATVKYVKAGIKEACGEEDPECMTAVEEQFDDCHAANKHTWQEYMNSKVSEEDAILESYSVALYGCIVDKDGEPYFSYDAG